MVVDCDQCRFRVLGPVQVATARGPLAFPRRQQLDLLALLLLNVDRVLPIGQIVDAMWGQAAPRTASTQITNMVSALRHTLVDGPQPLATLDRQPAGYRLRIADGDLDVVVFTALLARARDAAEPATVARTLRRALGLWQSAQALAGVRAEFAGAARTHLHELRTTALEDLFDAELACANHTTIVAELTNAVADHPGRERLAGQLMVALHRAGRTADALSVYRRVRRVLAEDYGLEPGVDLRALERLILLGDPVLDLSAPTDRGTARRSPAPTPAQLPLEIAGFVGRGTELARLDTLVAGERPAPAVVIAALTGPAGIGKSSLAVHWAHRVAGRFPDGQLYVNLRGFDPGGPALTPAEAVRGFLDAFGIPPERIPAGLHAQAALYRSLVAGREILVVLDNAVSADQVRPLLPGAPGCLVVVTSRNRLLGLVASEGALPITLDLLTAAEARDLLVARLGAPRVVAEEGAAAQIVAQCAGLPLALAVVAARAAVHPTFPLAGLSTELFHARGALAAPDASSDVHTVFSWSYERLSPAAARLFRLLGLHPGQDIGTTATASLTGLPCHTVRPLLAELTDAHLVTEHQPGRFAMHDLLRAYAADLAGAADPEDERGMAVLRLLDHFLHTASAGALLLYPHRYEISLEPAAAGVTIEALTDHDQALGWFAVEHRALVAAVELAAAGGRSTHAWQLALTIGIFLDRQCHWHDWAATQKSALTAVDRAGDRVGRAHASGGLGLAYIRLRDFDLAHVHLRRSLELLGELGERVGQAYTHLRMCAVYEGRGEHADALRHAELALDLYQAAGHLPGFAQALNNIGWYHAQLGRYEVAIDHCERAVALHRELGDRQGAAHTLDSLGYAHHQLGHHEQAATFYRESAQMLREAGDRYYAAIALTHLGDTHCAAGEADLARDAWREALAILDALSHPDVEQITAKLHALSHGIEVSGRVLSV
jgi:DNA-binding SARP family transcriptional activator/tetratricopeptide (TPR) repeat protein